MSASVRPPEALLTRLEWTVLKRLDGLLHGDYRTLQRGQGLDLADLREYQFHDDVRHIDWNVTARMSTPYVREYNEERDLSAWFLLDLSGSVDFGSGTATKSNVSAEFVATLARVLTRHGNRVGALLYGNDVDAIVPARSGRRHVLHLLHVMQGRPPAAVSGPTHLKKLLDSALRIVKRRSLVFVVSDFISEPGWERSLAWLAQRHEVIAVRLTDPFERELPDLGVMVMQDAETGEALTVDTHDRGFRRRFAALAAQREDSLREGLAKAGVDTVELATDDDLADAIMRFVDLRRRASRNGVGTMPAHLGPVAHTIR